MSITNTSTDLLCIFAQCYTKRWYFLFSIVTSLTCSVAMFLHMFGFYLLMSLHSRRHQTIHSILTINLSAVEVLLMAATGTYHVTVCFLLNALPLPLDIIQICSAVQDKLAFSWLTPMWYLIMLFITLNRLIGTRFPMKHRVYATKARLKRLLAATWMACSTHGVAGFVFDRRYYISYPPKYIYIHVVTVMLLFFFVICIVTYAIIFQQLVVSKRIMSSSSKPMGLFGVFRTSRFYTSIWLISTYTLFVLVPFTILNYYVAVGKRTEQVHYLAIILASINSIFDAFIYIYIDKDVRKHLWKTLHCTTRTCLHCSANL